MPNLRLEAGEKESNAMTADWERQAVVEDLTERITDGEFAGAYDELNEAVERAEVLSDRDRQQLLQYWVAKEREREKKEDG